MFLRIRSSTRASWSAVSGGCTGLVFAVTPGSVLNAGTRPRQRVAFRGRLNCLRRGRAPRLTGGGSGLGPMASLAWPGMCDGEGRGRSQSMLGGGRTETASSDPREHHARTLAGRSQPGGPRCRTARLFSQARTCAEYGETLRAPEPDRLRRPSQYRASLVDPYRDHLRHDVRPSLAYR